MTGLEQWSAWGALSQISYLGESEATLTRAEIGPYFDNLLAGWQTAHTHGLTRIGEIRREEDGFETSVVFDCVLTATGKAFVDGPAPEYKPTRSEERHAEMELQRNAARIRARTERISEGTDQ
jgi:hypothetical protein